MVTKGQELLEKYEANSGRFAFFCYLIYLTSVKWTIAQMCLQYKIRNQNQKNIHINKK